MELAFKNVIQLLDHFKDEATCTEFLEQQLWNGNPICPHCRALKPYKTTRGYKCSSNTCYKKFTVKVGTFYESSKLPLRIWFGAIYLCTAHKKGVSSHQLGRDLGVTQKTAWFLLHRIREMMTDKAPTLLTGQVQADETFIGGKESNKHQSAYTKRQKANDAREAVKQGLKPTLEYGRALGDKTPVVGVINDSKVIVKVIPNTQAETLKAFINWSVLKGSVLVTDEYRGYTKLGRDYKHETVSHIQGEYARAGFNTNSIEGFWSQLKRGIYGIYHHVTPKHLGAYCNEFAYRYNTRKVTDQARFFNTLTLAKGRLRYQDLIAE